MPSCSGWQADYFHRKYLIKHVGAFFPLSPFSPFGVVAAQKPHLKHKHMIGSLWCLLSIWDWLIVQSSHVIACTWFSRRKIGPEWLCCLHRHSFSLWRSQHCHMSHPCSLFILLSLSLSLSRLLEWSLAARCVVFPAVKLSPRPSALLHRCRAVAGGFAHLLEHPPGGAIRGSVGPDTQTPQSLYKSWHDSEVTRLAVAQVLWDRGGVRGHRIPNHWLKRWDWHQEKLEATYRWEPFSLSFSD